MTIIYSPIGSGDITEISVVVKNDNETLQLGTDESYSLDVSAPTVTLKVEMYH